MSIYTNNVPFHPFAALGHFDTFWLEGRGAAGWVSWKIEKDHLSTAKLSFSRGKAELGKNMGQ